MVNSLEGKQTADGDKRDYKGKVTDQRDRISKLFHSYVQTSRYRRDKSEKKKAYK